MTERPSLLRLHRAQVCQIPREQAVKLCRLLLASQRTWLLNKKTAKGLGLALGFPWRAMCSSSSSGAVGVWLSSFCQHPAL